jgi:hypothetical protein
MRRRSGDISYYFRTLYLTRQHLCAFQSEQQEISPLRFAPVEMTKDCTPAPAEEISVPSMSKSNKSLSFTSEEFEQKVTKEAKIQDRRPRRTFVIFVSFCSITLMRQVKAWARAS